MTPTQEPSPREDVLAALLVIEHSAKNMLFRCEHGEAIPPEAIRRLVDCVNNAAQALLGCAACLEGEGK